METASPQQVVSEKIKEFYQLKQRYDIKLKRQKDRILKNQTLTKNQKKRKYKEIQTFCVNCGKPGGTLFKIENKMLTAVCNAVEPCGLDIKINRGEYINLHDQVQYLENKVSTLRESIIETKLSILYNLSTKETALSIFEKLKKQLMAHSNELLSVQNTIKEITDNPKNKSLLSTAYIDLAEIKEQLHSILQEYKKTDNPQYAKDIIETVKSVVIPLTDKMRNLKYQYVAIEKKMIFDDKTNKEKIFNELVELPYTISQISKPIKPNKEAKIVSYKK